MNDFSNHQLVYVPHSALRQALPPLEVDDTSYLEDLRDHMWDVMILNKGIGLAANQINLNASVFVMKDQETNEQIFAINPAITQASEEKNLMLEGCLSDPGMYLKVKRPARIFATWQNIDGDREQREFKGLNARVFQHEFDHLAGVLITDRVGRVKLEAARKKQMKRLNG